MATMREVAQLAGVSVATVSFIVNDTKPVLPATRERVELAMAQLGFRRNVLARALASQRTRIIAIAYPSDRHRLGATALSILTGAASAASDRGHNVVLWPADYEGGKLADYVRGGLVDAVLLMEVRASDPRIDVLRDLQMPFGLIGRSAADEVLPHVDIDFERATVDGISHLRDNGHQKIALVVGRDEDSYGGYGPVLRTEEAFRQRMGQLGLEPIVVSAQHDPAGGVSAAATLTNDHPGVTGALVLNEAALFGFLSGLAKLGRRVPDDISVLGLATSAENVAIAEPVLSTLVAPGAEVGLLAVTTLIDALENPDSVPMSSLVPCILQPADSVARPK